jgi:hypothetical protein
VRLPESDYCIEHMIMHIYDVKIPLLDSVFDSFIHGSDRKKAAMLGRLLELYEASDKVGKSPIYHRAQCTDLF